MIRMLQKFFAFYLAGRVWRLALAWLDSHRSSRSSRARKYENTKFAESSIKYIANDTDCKEIPLAGAGLQ